MTNNYKKLIIIKKKTTTNTHRFSLPVADETNTKINSVILNKFFFFFFFFVKFTKNINLY